MNDPYTTLGISRGATDDEINKAYKKLAMQYHPDRNPGDKISEEKFKEINAARDAIKNDANIPHHMGGNPNDVFWQFNFGAGQGFDNLNDILAAMQAQQQRRNRDVNVEYQITLEEAFHGKEILVNIKNDDNVNTIAVKIPAGVDNGNRIRVPQAGDHTFKSMTPGDLYVTIQVYPHSRFKRQGKNLFLQIDYDVFDILLGNSQSVEGLDGQQLEVKVPKEFKSDMQLRVSGQGICLANSPQRGDLIISVRVFYPELSESQKAMIEAARKLVD
jgi:DnaJ-class molecular chaperone